MNSPDPHDAIERWLREDARRALPDDGFSNRVLAKLPAPARRPWAKPALILGATALGCILAVLLAPVGATLVQGYLDMASLRSLTPAAVTALTAAAAMAISAVVLATEAD